MQILRGGADVELHGAIGTGETEAAVHVPISEPTASVGDGISVRTPIIIDKLGSIIDLW